MQLTNILSWDKFGLERSEKYGQHCGKTHFLAQIAVTLLSIALTYIKDISISLTYFYSFIFSSMFSLNIIFFQTWFFVI